MQNILRRTGLEHARRSDRGVSGFHPWNEDPFLFALLLVGDADVSLSDRAKPADRSPSLIIFTLSTVVTAQSNPAGTSLRCHVQLSISASSG